MTIFFYLSMFFFGVISMGAALILRKIYIERRTRHREGKRLRAESEKDGWMKTKGFDHWSDRTKMVKWRDNIKNDLAVSEWIEENTKSYFKIQWIYGQRYIKFDNEADAMAFKLRWI